MFLSPIGCNIPPLIETFLVYYFKLVCLLIDSANPFRFKLSR